MYWSCSFWYQYKSFTSSLLSYQITRQTCYPQMGQLKRGNLKEILLITYMTHERKGVIFFQAFLTFFHNFGESLESCDKTVSLEVGPSLAYNYLHNANTCTSILNNKKILAYTNGGKNLTSQTLESNLYLPLAALGSLTRVSEVAPLAPR